MFLVTPKLFTGALAFMELMNAFVHKWEGEWMLVAAIEGCAHALVSLQQCERGAGVNARPSSREKEAESESGSRTCTAFCQPVTVNFRTCWVNRAFSNSFVREISISAIT